VPDELRALPAAGKWCSGRRLREDVDRMPIDHLLANNERFAAAFDPARLSVRPTRQLAIVTCMDARLDVFAMLGLDLGDAHVLRNAGGIVTDDMLRSVIISQRKLGTRSVLLVHHTRCGMLSFTDEELHDELEAETGVTPSFPIGTFADVDQSVRRSVERIRASPFVPHTDDVRGCVYDVDTGRIRPVSPD
jgi:carbonic anhydrase